VSNGLKEKDTVVIIYIMSNVFINVLQILNPLDLWGSENEPSETMSNSGTISH